MATFAWNNLQFHYISSGSGVPFIFQHGLGGSVEQAWPFVCEIKDLRTISFDFRGHGKTLTGPNEDFSFSTNAEDLIAFMDYLQLEKAIIGGISMGSGVALKCAVEHPERILGCVLVRPAWLDKPMKKSIREIFADVAFVLSHYPPETGRIRLAEFAWFKEIAETGPAVVNSFLNFIDDPVARRTHRKFRDFPIDAPMKNLRQLQSITAPVLVLANDFDPVHPLEYGQVLSENIPGANFYQVISKSEGEVQHRAEVQMFVNNFISENFFDSEKSGAQYA